MDHTKGAGTAAAEPVSEARDVAAEPIGRPRARKNRRRYPYSGRHSFDEKRGKSASTIKGQLRQKSANQNAPVWWIEVNSVTWKLTDGVMSRTSASFGQWGGYETERGLAWAIDAGWPFGKASWYARCSDNSYGPTSLSVAKRAAESFLTGAPLPDDENARSFIGPINLNAVTVCVHISRIDFDAEWIDRSSEGDAPR